MDVKTLVNILVKESHQLTTQFLEADKEYHKARIRNDQNSMAYWWNEEKKINDRCNDIASALRIIKEFSGEGLCF